MLQTSKLIPQGQGLASVLLKRAATVELDWDIRQKSRFDASQRGGCWAMLAAQCAEPL